MARSTRSFRNALLLLVAWIALASPALAAGPEGSYEVEGKGPGAGATSYRGTVLVSRKGDVYEVVWMIASETYFGIGILMHDQLSVAYQAGPQPGIAVYAPESSGWVGQWTWLGQSAQGTETWRRQGEGSASTGETQLRLDSPEKKPGAQ